MDKQELEERKNFIKTFVEQEKQKEEAKQIAREEFEKYPDLLTVHIPVIVPMSRKKFSPGFWDFANLQISYERSELMAKQGTKHPGPKKPGAAKK